MYLYDKNRITYFAETDRRNKRVPFGIKADDRTRHMYIIGKTGMGKSTLIENMVVQDIKNGEGFAFIDPHGKSAALLLDYIPRERLKDVVYFAPFDVDHPVSFNVMENVGADKRHLVANGLMSAFKKIWGPETWSARMEYILMNSLLALLEYPGSTLLGVSRMLTDKDYRKKVVDNIKDPSVKSYWTDEFAKYSENYTKEAVPGIQNKLGQFTSNPLIRNIIGQPKSSFDIRQMMDERKILIVNLSKGQLGEGNANLLGGMIITKIYLAAMSRADLAEGELKRLPNFYMYVDEFQSFANESFADILSEARKYKLALVVAHQYIKQMDEKVADAVFGNVGTQIMFRVGAPDAEALEKEYAPVFTAEDMVSLGMFQIYLKLMIDGVASHPFSAVSMPPIALPEKSIRDEVIASSRELYGHAREEVEKAIIEWYGSVNNAETKQPESSEARTAASGPSQAAVRTPYPPRSLSAPPHRNNMLFERERHHALENEDEQEVAVPQNTGRSSQPAQKSGKPFAEAFKNISKPASRETAPTRPAPTPAPVSASNTAPAKHRNVPSPFEKSKAPMQHHLSGLKAALADVLKEHKKSPEPERTAQKNTNAKSTHHNEHARPSERSHNVVVHEEQEKNDEQKMPEQPMVAKTLFEIPKELEPKVPLEIPKIKEVPEDVLTALLRGDE